MQADLMLGKVLSALERAGRDWKKIDRVIWEFKQHLLTLAGREEWGQEYKEYLMESFYSVLDPAIEEAVAREEFEWAESLRRQKELLLDWSL
jgi:hypothetical protein